MAFLTQAANRGSISTGYDIDNSLKLESNNSENLYRNLNASTSTTKFTISMWFKRTELGSSMLLYLRGVAGNESVILRTSTETNDALQVDIGASGTNSRSYTSQLLRDTSAWYHVVLAVDTTQSTATDRFKLYLNGNLITDFASRNNPAQNFAMEVSSAKHRHGAYNDTEGYAGYNGYIAEIHYVDGSQEAQTEFGEFDEDSGIWKPKQYTGSYGTGGYYLDFSDGSDLGANAKGDDVNFTLRNIAAADQSTDTPTNNFSNLEVGRNPAATFITFTEGNTKLTYAGSTTGYDSDGSGISNFRVNTSGKWYMEFSFAGDGDRAVVGVVSDQGASHAADTDYTRYIMYRANDGHVIYNTNGTHVNVSGAGPTYDSPDIIGIALDCDNERVSFSKNGSWIDGSGASASNSSPTYYVDWTGHDFLTNSTGNGNCVFVCTNYVNNGTPVIEANFGGYTVNSISSAATDANGYGTFEYAPPSGYYALCSKNLAEYG